MPGTSEEALGRLLAELEHAYHAAPVALCVLDRRLRFVRVNEAMATLNGRSLADHIGRQLHDVNPAAASRLESVCRRVLHDGQPVIDLDLRLDPGPHRWRVACRPYALGEGGVSLAILPLERRDDSPAPESAPTPAHSVNAFRWEADARTWQFRYVGRRAKEILGYPIERWYEKDFWVATIHPADRETATRSCRRMTQAGEDHQFEYRMLAADGRVVWIHDIVAVDSIDGEPRTLRGFMIDVTERKRAELAMEKRRRFDRMLAEISTELIGLPDDDVPHAVDDALQRLGEFFGADRCSIVAVEPDGALRRAHAWLSEAARPGGREEPVRLSGIPEAWDRDETVTVRSVEELPDEWNADRETLLAAGIRSLASAPFRVGRALRGAITVSTFETQCDWSGESTRRLRLVGEILANALSRRRTQRSLRTAQDQRKRVDLELQEQLRFERLVSDVSARFVSVTASGVDEAIGWALEKVSRHLGIDRSAVHELSADGSRLRISQSWTAPGITLRSPVGAEVALADLPPAVGSVLEGQLVRLSRVDEAADQATRRFLEREQTKSMLAAPLLVAGATFGELVLVSERTERSWPDQLAQRVRLLAEIFASALERRRTKDRAERALRGLSGRLIHAQEQERSRIARELHDDLSQKLALVTVELELLARGGLQDPTNVADRLCAVSQQVRQLSSHVHRLSHQLHPAKLEQIGLVAAMEDACRELTARHGLRVEFRHRNVPALPADVSLCLYRVAQEALQNVVRHSGAASAQVELSGESSQVRLTISDRGGGFETATPGDRDGLGLISMQERVRFVGGTLTLRSAPGAGTTISAVVPVTL